MSLRVIKQTAYLDESKLLRKEKLAKKQAEGQPGNGPFKNRHSLFL